MPTYSTSTPAATIRTETEPSAADYQFWIKPSTNEAFFSDGTTWQEIPTGAPATAILGIENALNILEIQAADTITPDTSAQLIREIFTDADGYNNTIDTGNTTATFNTDFYINPFIDEASGDTTHDPDAVTNPSNAFDGNDETYASHSLNTGEVIEFGKTFSSKVVSNLRYKIRITSSGSTYFNLKVQTYNGSTWSDNAALNVSTYATSSFPQTYAAEVEPNDGSEIQGIRFVATHTGSNNGGVEFYTIEYGKYATHKTIETKTLTLPSTPSKFIVFAFRDSTTGTGSITADISFDNGANYQTGVSLNTETSIINVGDEMILKLNLNAEAGTGTAKAKGYGVLFW